MRKHIAGIKSVKRSARARRGQLALDLRSLSCWGGCRAGAGRKRGANLRIPHARRASLASRHPCHVTLKLRRGLPSLRSIPLVRELERSFREIRDRRSGFRLVHYSFQHDHAHLIVEAADARELASGMKALGARLARAVNRSFGRRGAVLADRFHVHVLRTPTEVRRAIAYVLLNARRHAAKLGQRLSSAPTVDPASSGRWFEGWRVPQRAAPDAPAVAAPRTWLLRIGWRRVGRIDPAEVPGGM